MSELSFMEKLLDGVEVEWKTIGEVCEVFTGGEPPENTIKGSIPTDDCRYPIYGNGAEIYGYTDTYRVDKDAVTISSIGANTGAIYYRNAFFTPIIRLKVLMPKNEWLLSKYIFHYLSSQTIYSKKSSVPNMNAADVKKLEIPIPCPDNPEKSLAIQAEIVRILDAFTAMTAELTAELNLRKKQYNHYRDQLLSFEEGEVEWKTLGELAENLDSKRKPITSGLREAGNIPYYGASGIVDYVKDYIFDGDFLLVSEDGANLLARNTPIAFSISGKTWVNNHAHVLKFETYAERRYVEYYLNSIDLTPYISGAAQPKLNKKNLESIRIPNPSPTEKERIVSILDKFDALTSSITEGLPREIELRQKQYEYYRDLLLSFSKLDAEGAA